MVEANKCCSWDSMKLSEWFALLADSPELRSFQERHAREQLSEFGIKDDGEPILTDRRAAEASEIVRHIADNDDRIILYLRPPKG